MAGQDAYEALRGQRTARTAGWHPDELVEPGVQPGHGGAPSPSLPHIARGDTLDALTLSFLVHQAVLAQEKEKDLFARRTAEYVTFALPVLFVHFSEEKEKEEKEEAPEVRVPTLSSWLWTSL